MVFDNTIKVDFRFIRLFFEFCRPPCQIAHHSGGCAQAGQDHRYLSGSSGGQHLWNRFHEVINYLQLNNYPVCNYLMTDSRSETWKPIRSCLKSRNRRWIQRICLKTIRRQTRAPDALSATTSPRSFSGQFEFCRHFSNRK